MAAVLWIVVLMLGCVAQLLISSNSIFWGLLLYLVCGSTGFWLLFLQNLFPLTAKPDIRVIKLDVYWIPAALGVLCVIGASWCIWTSTAMVELPPNYFFPATLLWLLFLLLIGISPIVCLIRTARNETPRYWLILGMLVLFSCVLGMYRLAEVPYTVHADEGMVGVYARQILEGKMKTFFSTSWYSIPQLFYFVPACGMYLFGDDLFGLRMSTVIVGTLSVIPFFVVSRAMWGWLAAIMASVLLICNHWFLHLMHCGVNYVQASFFCILLFCVWHFANQSKRLSLCVLAGLIMGIALLSYQANHLIPFLWVFAQMWMWIVRWADWKWWLLSTLIPIVLAILTILPLHTNQAGMVSKHGMFSARARGVVVWTEHNLKHMNYAYHAEGNMNKVWRIQTQRALLSPIAYHDTSIQYGGTIPFLDRFTAVLFMIGVVVSAHRFFDPKWSAPVLWVLGILIAGGILTVDPPFYPRLAGITALLYLIVGGAIASWLQLAKQTWISKLFVYVPIGMFLIAVSSIHLHYYFDTYAQKVSRESVHYPQTRLAYYILDHDPNTTFFIIPGEHFTSQSGTVLFMADEYRAMDVETPPPVFPKQNQVLVVHPSQENEIAQYRLRYPNMEFNTHKKENGEIIFYSFEHP